MMMMMMMMMMNVTMNANGLERNGWLIDSFRLLRIHDDGEAYDYDDDEDDDDDDDCRVLIRENP